VLASVGAVALLPLAVIPAGGAGRRAAQAAAGMLAAAVAAGVGGGGLPITGATPPDISVAGAESPLESLTALWAGVSGSNTLLLETAAIALAAAAIGLCRHRAAWGGAAFGALLAASTLLADPNASALPLVAAAWVAAILLALEPATARPVSDLVRRFVPGRPRLRLLTGS
jgi:hypothetical protein